jgi:hypothetical protein
MTWGEYLAAQLDGARGISLQVINDFADEDFFRKFDRVNPGIWVLGHMAVSEPGIVFSSLGEAVPRPEQWQEWFGIGTKLLDDLAKYPPVSEVRRVLHEGHQKTVARVRRLSDDELAAPINPDMKIFDWIETVRDGIGFAVIHEANHGGQLMWLRKLLGKPGLI